MKKINKCFYMIIAMLLSIFIIKSNVVNAEGEVIAPVVPKVVINADFSGKASNVFSVAIDSGNKNENGDPIYNIENRQYTRSRDIVITINLSEQELIDYDNKFNICEVIPSSDTSSSGETERCSFYSITKKSHNFQIYGTNDGKKEIRVYFYSNFANQSIAASASNLIYLDTVGPAISLNGGEYVFVPSGKKYSDQGATCEDGSDIVSENGCNVVTQSYEIDYKKDGYQYIRYTAVDFLGNETNMLRKVMVEQKSEKKGLDLYWYFAIGAVVIVTLAMGYIVIKNKEKQKNQSVL